MIFHLVGGVFIKAEWNVLRTKHFVTLSRLLSSTGKVIMYDGLSAGQTLNWHRDRSPHNSWWASFGRLVAVKHGCRVAWKQVCSACMLLRRRADTDNILIQISSEFSLCCSSFQSFKLLHQGKMTPLIVTMKLYCCAFFSGIHENRSEIVVLSH